MTMVVTTLASTTNKTADLGHLQTQADYLAEAGIEAARIEVQASIVAGDVPQANGSVVLDGQTVTYTVVLDAPEHDVVDNDGIEARVTDYLVQTQVDLGGAVARASSLLRAKEVYPYQFTVFYDTDAWMTMATTMFIDGRFHVCLLYTSPSPRDRTRSRMPSSA